MADDTGRDGSSEPGRDAAQKARVESLLHTEAYQEVEPLMKTTYERGIEEGIERGIIQGERRSALRLLEARFGPLSPEVQQRVEALSPEALDQLLLDLLTAQTLDDIRLDG